MGGHPPGFKGEHDWFESPEGWIVSSKRHGAFITKIDKEDHERIKGIRWCLVSAPQRTDCLYFQGTKHFPDGSKKAYRLHRLIMEAPTNMVVDHRDPHNTLDNRKSNLKVVTQKDNLGNKRKRTAVSTKKTTSHFKGVFANRQNKHKKWTAQASVGGKNKFLGSFEDEVEAAVTYDMKAREIYGEHARVNFPDCLNLDCARAAVEAYAFDPNHLRLD